MILLLRQTRREKSGNIPSLTVTSVQMILKPRLTPSSRFVNTLNGGGERATNLTKRSVCECLSLKAHCMIMRLLSLMYDLAPSSL